MDTVFWIILLYGTIHGSHGAADAGRPVVDTYQGKFTGSMQTIRGTDRTVDVFYGIPYAESPVGPLRFAAPKPAEPWTSIREATKPPPMCLQPVEVTKKMTGFMKMEITYPPMSEDCLYLNVFTPSDRASNSKLPVMVFIHGGGLVLGLASMYDGSALSANENVVYVAIQYRLGLMGFLSTQEEQKVSGNYGLLDQVEALRWVQKNIHNFGGDPECVTVFGESAGGTSISALVLSPMANGLFHRAIAESGVVLMPGLTASSEEELIFFRNLVADMSGCQPSSLLDCLRMKSEQELSLIISGLKLLPLPICVDGVFLTKSVEEILSANENSKVPFLIGVNEQEYHWLMPKTLDFGYMDGLPKDLLQSELTQAILLGGVSRLNITLLDEYFGDTDDPLEIRDSFLDLHGDVMFVIPALKIAKHHRDSGSSIYFYQFLHRPSLFNNSRPDWVNADHSDEQMFVLGSLFVGDGSLYKSHNFSKEEKKLSRTMMKYWANFARTGDPNCPGLVQWPRYDKNENYLQIDIQQKVAQKLKEEKYIFWTKVLPEKIQKISEEERDHTKL